MILNTHTYIDIVLNTNTHIYTHVIYTYIYVPIYFGDIIQQRCCQMYTYSYVYTYKQVGISG